MIEVLSKMGERLLTVLKKIKFECKSISAYFLPLAIVESVICFIADEVLVLRSLYSRVNCLGQFIQLNKEGTNQFLGVWLSVGLLGCHFIPELNLKWGSKCLLDAVLIREVEWQEYRLLDVEAEHVESS